MVCHGRLPGRGPSNSMQGKTMNTFGFLGCSLVLLFGISTGQAQQTGQPASNVLSSEDLWANPTFVGGVTNGGPHSHSVW